MIHNFLVKYTYRSIVIFIKKCYARISNLEVRILTCKGYMKGVVKTRMKDMTIMQEMTGIRLFQEQEILLDQKNLENLYKKINQNETKVKSGIVKADTKQICEIYFDSSYISEIYPEQFMLTMEQKGKRKVFILKRKNKIGGYESEKSVKISKEQYRNILQGCLDWMKQSGKTLLNEFYSKTKIFHYKISKIVKCYREEVYLKYEKLLLTIDQNLRVFTTQNVPVGRINENKKVSIKVRTTLGQKSDYILNTLIDEK